MSDPIQKALDALIGIPFLVGGRSGKGIDCYGVTLAVLVIFDRPAIDIWDSVQEVFEHAQPGRPLDLAPLVPDGWRQITDGNLADGDAVVIPGHVGAFARGYVYTATEGTGSIRHRWAAFEVTHGSRLSVWRWGGAE
jgi:hypothetical protein